MKYHRAHLDDMGADLGWQSIAYTREPTPKLPAWQNEFLSMNKDIPNEEYFENSACMSQGFTITQFFDDETFKLKRLRADPRRCYGKTFWYFENHHYSDNYLQFYLYTITSEQEHQDARYDPYRYRVIPKMKCIRNDSFSKENQDIVKNIISEVAAWNVSDEYIAAWKKEQDDW